LTPIKFDRVRPRRRQFCFINFAKLYTGGASVKARTSDRRKRNISKCTYREYLPNAVILRIEILSQGFFKRDITVANFSKILCIVDPTSDIQPALQRAAWLAGHSGATLELFICYYNEYLRGDQFLDSRSFQRTREEAIAAHKNRLEKMAQPLREKGLKVRTSVVWEHPLYEAVVRHATSESLAKLTGAEVHAFHSFDPRLAFPVATANAYIPVLLEVEGIGEIVRTEHEKRFAAITQSHELDAERSHFVSGFAHEELPALAKTLRASVVVMGAIARNRLKRLFIGATAERTLEELPCDLLIVKPDWYYAPIETDEVDANHR
jgi:nucleotide-binding universal stress UspA family protein